MLEAIIIRIKKIKVTAGLIVALFLMGVLNMRPAIVGQFMGSLYLGILVTLLLLGIFMRPILYVHRFRSFFFLSGIVFLAYVILQIPILNLTSYKVGFGASVYLLFGYITVLICNKDDIKIFVKLFILLNVLFGISYLVSYALYISVGLYLPLFNIALSNSDKTSYVLPVLFPYSPVYNGIAAFAGYFMPRAIGFMREPGIYQLMVIIAFWLNSFYDFKLKRAITIILIFTLLFTFSTTGYALLLLTLFWKYFRGAKKGRRFLYYSIGIPLIAGLFFLLLTSESQFGLQEKLDAKSGSSRIFSILASKYYLEKSPYFGIGFRNDPDAIELGINFIGTTAQLGIVGTLIILIPFVFVGVKLIKSKVELVNIYLALIATMLIAQPIVDKPFTFLFLSILVIMSEKSNTRISNEKTQ